MALSLQPWQRTSCNAHLCQIHGHCQLAHFVHWTVIPAKSQSVFREATQKSCSPKHADYSLRQDWSDGKGSERRKSDDSVYCRHREYLVTIEIFIFTRYIFLTFENEIIIMLLFFTFLMSQSQKVSKWLTWPFQNSSLYFYSDAPSHKSRQVQTNWLM